MGLKVVSVDLETKYKPDILTDILEWDYKNYYKTTGFVPDLIWASPPCNTFSTLAYPLKERDIRTAEPFSERAKQGTQILYRTMEIIEFYQKINPNLVYVIENPKGMMRFDAKVKALPHRSTTLYCLYEDVRRKPTDFFNNITLRLKDPEQNKCDRAKLVSVVDLPLNERYKIPKKLVKDILVQMVVRYKQNKREARIGGDARPALADAILDVLKEFSKIDLEEEGLWGFAPYRNKDDFDVVENGITTLVRYLQTLGPQKANDYFEGTTNPFLEDHNPGDIQQAWKYLSENELRGWAILNNL